jgi:NADH:ubiquinone oxidoreductase subunit 3 (subunit A)
MTPLAAYVLLFLAVGVGFIFVHLVVGKLIRPSKKNPEKDTIYECGEPTIGSAWVQFDLRFYVVALLFVIFDVEVAFFFPWAEVFGKANAIRNAPTPRSPKELPEEHNAFANKVLDLAVPPGSKSGDRSRTFWEGVKALTDQKTEQKQLVEEYGGRLRATVSRVNEEQEAESRKIAEAAKKLPESVLKQLQGALTPPIAGPAPKMKLPSGAEMLQRELGERAAQVKDILEGTSLGKLRELKYDDIELAYRPAVLKLMAKHLPRELESVRAMAKRQAGELREVADAFLAAADPQQRRVFEGVNVEMMDTLATYKVTDARNAATNLAWLAFFEIVVFFGVLLVGFAYLWRRGDLAWVRSTAAESSAPIRELEAVGKGS